MNVNLTELKLDTLVMGYIALLHIARNYYSYHQNVEHPNQEDHQQCIQYLIYFSLPLVDACIRSTCRC